MHVQQAPFLAHTVQNSLPDYPRKSGRLTFAGTAEKQLPDAHSVVVLGSHDEENVAIAGLRCSATRDSFRRQMGSPLRLPTGAKAEGLIHTLPSANSRYLMFFRF
jgi:hypothetical protein